MNRKFGQIGIIGLVLVLALAITGVGFAHWQQTLYINSTAETGELDWEFEAGSLIQRDPCDPPTNDSTCEPDWTNKEQVDKNVGCTELELVDTDNDGDYDVLEVTLHNVYPCYYEHIAFEVHNNGTIPLIIDKVIIDGHEFRQLPAMVDLDLNGDEEYDLNVRYGNNFGVQLHECEMADISFDLHVKQAAPQGATALTFTIEIGAIQWNEYE